MISPRDLRPYALPGYSGLLRSLMIMACPISAPCGNISAIMDDLIADVGRRRKHSYEDAIIPVEDFQRTYGDRIAVLGRIDINILFGEPHRSGSACEIWSGVAEKLVATLSVRATRFRATCRSTTI